MPTRAHLLETELRTRFKWVNGIFLSTVVVPTLLSVIYFGFMASDVYISESRFIVRMPERQGISLIGSFLQGAGFTRSQDDSYTVHDFMLSRDALKVLENKLGIRKLFSDSSIDIFNRFDPLGLQGDFEDLYFYYPKIVSLFLDTASSITTLKVRAYKPEHAFSINKVLLDIGEELINKLNERGRQDMMTLTERQVSDAERKSTEAAIALTEYQNSKGLVDPIKQSTLQLEQVARLQTELIGAKSQLEHLETFAKNNPQIPAVKKRIQTLEQEIRSETEKVVGGSMSMVNQAPDYQRLLLEKEFADKQLASALASLENARNEMLRKQLYLERIVQPNLPDAALEPIRLRWIIATFLLSLVTWGLVSLFIAAAKEHRD